MIDLSRLRAEFAARFGGSARIFSAPGRVNLIGEHTDYNDGFVLPMAIERRTYVAAAARADGRVVAHSLTQGSSFELELAAPARKRRGMWGDYVEGTARALAERGARIVGASLLIDSDVPLGAGVSASAALEMAVGLALLAVAGQPDYDRVGLALAGQAAEHEYVGTRSGIMDQYISALGRAGHALLIDCRTLEPTPVPIELAGASVVICDTQVKHELASSEYNKRRAECEQAVRLLSAELPGIRALRDVGAADLERFGALLPEVVLRRARHVVSENARTLAAVDALGKGTLDVFGKLMVESHRSLQLDYEVSCAELDVAVESALASPGVYGARMTGGGFGGCTVTLVEKSAIAALSAAVQAAFAGRFATRPELFASGGCEGVKEHA